jgi:hypothetical protein
MPDRYREPPHISSTLEWKDVSLPPAVSVDDLDRMILSKLRPGYWLKTARIIVDVMTAFKDQSIELDCEIVGARIRALADAEEIDSAGNVAMWRHSEVRLKGPG